MTLCIVGKQILDQLQKWAISLFKDVPNRNAPNPADEYWGKIPPFLPQKEASLLEIVPVGEQRLLSIAWPIWVVNQAQRDALVRTKPDQVFTEENSVSSHSNLSQYNVLISIRHINCPSDVSLTDCGSLAWTRRQRLITFVSSQQR